jgi:dihydrolipoamide dehydrogenase
MADFDLLVIGAGPGGYVAAIRASQLGMKVGIIDKEWLGGVCLNVGCIPSKALLKNAEVAHLLREKGKEFGFSFENLSLDYSAAVKRSRQVSDRLTRGVGFLMKKNNITVLMGTARLTDRNTVQVTNAAGQSSSYSAKNILIATGSTPSVPPAFPVDGEKVLTFREAILQERRPESVVIIGAGAIGLEFATVWSGYGTKVTLVEMLPRIAPLEDEEVSAELTKAFNKRGIKTLTGTRVMGIQALVAIGFRPNTANLGLEEAGVSLTERRFIDVDERMATNVPGIWAIGDVTGKLLLAHTASAQGILCAEAMAGKETRAINYTMIPRATYSQPQVASFGLTEAQAREKGLNFKIGKFPFQASGKALGLGDYGGFAKVLVDSDNGELLGAHLIGPEVSELLPELTLAWRNGLSAEEVGSNIHAHPTLSEVIAEAVEVAEGKAIQI